MKGLKPASIAISLLTLAAAMWASPARAQPPMVPVQALHHRAVAT